MVVNGFLPVFLCGIFGAFLGELFKWYRIRESKELPEYARSPAYWIVTGLIILSGGVLAILYGTEQVNAILALNIGITSPLIIQSVARMVPESATASKETTPKQTGKKIKRLLGSQSYIYNIEKDVLPDNGSIDLSNEQFIEKPVKKTIHRFLSH